MLAAVGSASVAVGSAQVELVWESVHLVVSYAMV